MDGKFYILAATAAVMLFIIWLVIRTTSHEKHKYTTLDGVPSVQDFSTNTRRRDICLVLTMYGEESRLERYRENVDLWLQHTDMDIFVVDSSGNFSHPSKRVRVESFVQDANGGNDVSQRESDSLRHLYEARGDELSRYRMLCKVTAKYFVKGLEQSLDAIPENAEVVLQSRQDCHGQNSEIFVVSPQLLPVLTYNLKHTMEKTVMELGHDRLSRGTVYRLPTFQIPMNTWVRNDGLLLTWL